MSTAPFLAPHRNALFAQGHPRISGTNYYVIPGVTGGQAATLGSFGLTTGTDHYFPIFMRSPDVCDQIAAEVSIAGTNMRMGIYAADRRWQPVGPPLMDSGSVAIGSTGLKTYTPGTPVFMPEGRYLTVLNCDNGGTLIACKGSGIDMASATTNMSPVSAFRVTRAYAAFPNPGTAWDTTSQSMPALLSPVMLRFLS